MELFLQPEAPFEKTAGTKMPEDPNAWPQEILQQLFKEVPYMSDFSPHVTMDKVDGEKGYAFGHITVMNQTETQMGAPAGERSAAGIRQVRIPVVIKDGEMFPLDLLVTDGSKVLPLTESRLRAAVFRPQAFDVTAKTPGDQSMIGQLYPPFRQNNGFGGGGTAMSGGMGKEGSALEEFLTEKEAGLIGSAARKASEQAGGAVATGAGKAVVDAAKTHKNKLIGGAAGATVAKGAYDSHRDKRVAKNIVGELRKSASIVEEIRHTMNQSDLGLFRDALQDSGTRLAYEKNAGANYDAVKMLLEPQAEMPKLASVMHQLIRPEVTQVTRTPDGNYTVKTASSKLWAPHMDVLDRGTALQKLGSKVVLAADTAGSVTMSEGAEMTDPEAPQEGVEGDSDMGAAGPASVFGLYRVLTEEGQEVVGYVIPDLLDIDGTPSPISLFTNGSQAAIQGDIIGAPIPGDAEQLPTGDQPQGYGAFFSAEGEGAQATIPLKLMGSFDGGEGQPGVFQGETYDGRPVEVSVQPNIQTVVAMEEGRMLVPAHWQWLPLDQAEAVDLQSSEQEVPGEKEASARRAFASVDVVSGGETFTVRGLPVEKLASADTDDLDLPGALFLLAGLGVSHDYGVQKLAESMSGHRAVPVRIGRTIKLAADEAKLAAARGAEMLERMPNLRQNLFKEAAYINDPDAVDTVLSLGFINPENINTFINYMSKIDETQECLCNLLFASRMGMSDVPESALESAVRGAEQVLEGLKAIAFQGPAKHS